MQLERTSTSSTMQSQTVQWSVFPSRLIKPFQVTKVELVQALEALPVGKALPPHLPPAILWRAAAPVAEQCLQRLNHWLANMDEKPPEDWHMADIFLMPKPHKPVTAENLRPIALLHPIAKASACILKHKIQDGAWQMLLSQPQFAYLAHRGVADALGRALAHCEAVSPPHEEAGGAVSRAMCWTAEADRCWQHCSRLAQSGACRAVAMTMRGEKLGRTGPADNIQAMINNRCAAL